MEDRALSKSSRRVGPAGAPGRCFPALLIALFVLLWFTNPVFAEDFTIVRFDADINVNQDSTVLVHETIVVRFHIPKHGIFREIPFKFQGEDGSTVKTPVTLLSVTDQMGQKLNYKKTRKENVINIRIGDPRHYVDGVQTYVLEYQVENAVLFFEDHDEFYWNVTGNYWWTEIENVSAKVNLAAKDKSLGIWAACYTGAIGSKEHECAYQASDNSAQFSTNRTLRQREGLTIAFGWDKNLIAKPSSFQKFLWVVAPRENWIFLLPFVSLIIMIHMWRTRGRDPRVREAIAPRYEPPRHDNVALTPAEVGVMIDEKADPRDITSTIVGLATKGFIRIEESRAEGFIFDSTDYYLVRLKEPDESLSPFERLLMHTVFTGDLPGRMVSDLKNSFYAKIDLLKSTVYGELVTKKFFLTSPDHVRRRFIVAAVIVAVAGFFLFQFLAPSSGSVKGIIAALLTALPVFAFSGIMPAKTKSGSRVYAEILGFQEFMRRAEKDRLERMGDKDLFSKFLPYAIALDVVDNWAAAFEGIYQEPPRWYVGHGGFTTFHPAAFSRSLTAATSSLATAMYSAPRGSGTGSFSGGGGFSGGGFGGGGGGSW